MTTTFTSSRLGNLREKKSLNMDQPQNTGLKLTLPPEFQKSEYEPTLNLNNTRTNTRFLKGRIERPAQKIESNNNIPSKNNINSDQKLTLLDEPKEQLKLVIHDTPVKKQKSVSQTQGPKPVEKKKILIARQSKEEEKKPQVKIQPKPEQELQKPIKVQQKQQTFQQKPIKQQDVQQSKDQPENQNDLVMCPEGCGRKFNRKALQKHAKACKLVFMSKRKQFNSEAKRISSKQQAAIVKQNKLKQKKDLGKTKGFEKTGDNWKHASQDFRSAIKAIKKQQKQEKNEQEQEMDVDADLTGKQQAISSAKCQYCQKMFSQMLIQKHLQNCIKKKQKQQKQKKKGGKKK